MTAGIGLLLAGLFADGSRETTGCRQGPVLACHRSRPAHADGRCHRLAEEMDRAGADWQLITHGGAMHGFTHQHAVPGAVPGVAYHPRADERSSPPPGLPRRCAHLTPGGAATGRPRCRG